MNTFRPRSARTTARVIGALAIAGAVAHTIADGLANAAPTIGLAVLACAVAVFAYWLPALHIGADAVVVANVVSTVTVPWARVERVDTRFVLELVLKNGRKVGAFCAPAPGTFAVRTSEKDDFKRLPRDTYVDGTVRIGDRPGTPSGDAALLVRAALRAYRDSGATSDAPVSRELQFAPLFTLVGALIVAAIGFTL